MTVHKLRPEIKTIIVEALLSGKYDQGRLALRKSECYCCHGVITDIAAQHGIVEWEKETGRLEHWGVREVDGTMNTTGLPTKVSAWLGLPETNGDIRFGDDIGETLMTLNDHEDYSFPEIAEVIKEHL